eukprot:scaffold3944_cov361-Prasinococcus_capsulatus_cf.AAC.1
MSATCRGTPMKKPSAPGIVTPQTLFAIPAAVGLALVELLKKRLMFLQVRDMRSSRIRPVGVRQGNEEVQRVRICHIQGRRWRGGCDVPQPGALQGLRTAWPPSAGHPWLTTRANAVVLPGCVPGSLDESVAHSHKVSRRSVGKG